MRGAVKWSDTYIDSWGIGQEKKGLNHSYMGWAFSKPLFLDSLDGEYAYSKKLKQLAMLP